MTRRSPTITRAPVNRRTAGVEAAGSGGWASAPAVTSASTSGPMPRRRAVLLPAGRVVYSSMGFNSGRQRWARFAPAAWPPRHVRGTTRSRADTHLSNVHVRGTFSRLGPHLLYHDARRLVAPVSQDPSQAGAVRLGHRNLVRCVLGALEDVDLSESPAHSGMACSTCPRRRPRGDPGSPSVRGGPYPAEDHRLGACRLAVLGGGSRTREIALEDCRRRGVRHSTSPGGAGRPSEPHRDGEQHVAAGPFSTFMTTSFRETGSLGPPSGRFGEVVVDHERGWSTTIRLFMVSCTQQRPAIHPPR